MKTRALAISMAVFWGLQCSDPQVIPLEIPKDGLYDSAYPHTDVSDQLNRLSESVMKIYFTAYYTNYFFPGSAHVEYSHTKEAIASKQYSNDISFNRSSFGTATVIANERGNIVLLSCAHIGSFPDTIISYYEREDTHGPHYVESIAIKNFSTHFVEHKTLKGDLELLASDQEKDLALFGIKQPVESSYWVPAFPYPFGDFKNLTWGSLVYMMGYPIGHKMVTQGMVSPTEEKESHTFMVDALFNKGFSGGVVLAVKDGVPNFELVGLAKSISAQTEFFLTPDSKDVLNYSNSFAAYDGDIFVSSQRTLHYGVTYCVTIDAICSFINENREPLKTAGYTLPATCN